MNIKIKKRQNIYKHSTHQLNYQLICLMSIILGNFQQLNIQINFFIDYHNQKHFLIMREQHYSTRLKKCCEEKWPIVVSIIMDFDNKPSERLKKSV